MQGGFHLSLDFLVSRRIRTLFGCHHDRIETRFGQFRYAVGARQGAGTPKEGEVAAPLGMSRATVSAIENGTVSEIGVRKLMALCASLGLALSVAPRGQRPTLIELREEQRAALKSRA